MYKYNTETNELVELEATTFSDNNILERTHIEEWIRKNPEVLGEELLIIGHEYDKFDSSERLDLLAIDKDGKLVIIELKRDNSGSSVDFQCLKYCSYCSQLTPQDIIEIYSEYLKENNDNRDPVDSITDFINLSQGNEDNINEILNNAQRFIIVGKEIDKRILSVCAWLFENGIEAKCMSIKPFRDENSNILIDFDQIIPPYKIGDYYIQKKESKIDRKTINQPSEIISFFENVVEIVKDKTNFKIYYNLRKPYSVVRLGNKVETVIVYKKRDKKIEIKAQIKDASVKQQFSSFYDTYGNTLSELIGMNLEYQEEGDRNPDWSYIRTLVKVDENTQLVEMSEIVAELLIKFSNFVLKNWN